MAKSRARFLSELLGTTGLVKKSKSALAGADEVIDLSTLPSIPNSKLTNSSITINSSATSLGGSVTLTTANVAENTNLYYTDSRVDARITAADTGDLSEGSNLYYTNARADARVNLQTGSNLDLSSKDTGDLSEGSNLYYTNARADARIAAADTGDLSEGSNLYYTDARADARVALVVDSAPGTLNTLNELAAALGDDANFSTTVTNSIAAKLPLAGGTMTGGLNMGSQNISAINNATAVSFLSTNGYWVGGTQRMNGSGNLLNIGSITANGTLQLDGSFVIDTDTGNQPLCINRLSSTGTADNQSLRIHIDDSAAVFESEQDETGRYGGYVFRSKNSTNVRNRYQIEHTTGDSIWYNDAGTAKMLWDASEERLGINTTTPATTLDVNGAITSTGTGSFAGKLTISNASYANHLELVRGSDTIYLTPSGGQLLTNGGFSPDVTNQDDLGRTDKYWQDLWLGTSLKMGGTTVIDANRNITAGTISSGAITSSAHTIYTQASTLEGINLVANVNSANQNSDSPKIQFNGEYQSNGPYIYGDNIGSYGYKSLKFYTNRNSVTDYTTAPTVTLTLDSTGNAQFTGTLSSGAITGTGAINSTGTGRAIQVNGTTRINSVGDIIGTSYYVGANAIVDTNRNLLNIGTISSGAITTSSTFTGHNINLRNDTAGDGAIIRDISFLTTAAQGTDDRVALIRASNQGGDGTNRGGKFTFYTRQSGAAGFNSALILDKNGNSTFAGTISSGAITSTGLTVNGGSTNVVANFVSTDSIAGIKLQDNNGNVELSASGSTFRVQPSGNAPVFEIDSSGNTDIAGTIGSGAITSTGAVTGTYFSDGYVTWNGAQFNRSGAAIEFQFTPTNANWKVKIGANGDNPTEFNAYTGDADFSGEVSTPSAKLKAIAESNTDTAVALFVYDTRKDSDGGAWRKRTQNTSWYNETLNTSTRGARKEFPSVAVIVAEQNELTIYDGDDPALPMWMVFSAPNGGWSSYAMGGGTTISSVKALNATIAVGNSGYGLTLNNFISERSSFQENGYNRLKYGGLVARNNGMTVSGDFGSGANALHMGELVHDQVYDVDLMARRNAPIDPLTGLPALTIGVATYQGLNIFKDDATRITRLKAETSNHVTKIMFDGDDHYVYVEYHSSTGHASAIRRADLNETGNLGGIHHETPDRYFSNYDWAVYNHSSYGHDETAASHGTAIASTNDFFLLGSPRHIAGNLGLTQVFSSSEAPPYTYNYITSSYNTGWMFKDIKLATLSNTSTAAYAAAVDGISAGSAPAGATSSISGGVLTATSSSASNVAWIIPITLVEGRTYSVSMQRESGGDSFTRVYGPWSTAHAIKRSFASTGSVETITFTARTGGTSISLVGASANSVVKVSSISVREAERDRTWNDKGFKVHGAVTKAVVATGASLVGYSGWSTSNYLEQPYNGDLNFGTGGYSIAVWVNRDSGSALRYVYCRGTGDGTETIRLGIRDAGIYFDYGNGAAYTQTNINFPNAVWTHVFCTVNAGGKGKVYVNGIQQTTTVNNVAPSPLMNAANYTSLIGRHYDNNNDYVFSGDIALLRISGQRANSEQIAKMYNDERHLFEPNAKAVLNASSNIDGIAYDQDTELLYVGTASGRNTFQGLRRVDTTTDAITKAISASNGFIVEE